MEYRLLTSYQLLLAHRYYSHDYYFLFSHSFGESGTPQNENGWYLIVETTPLERWKFFTSLDLFSFPWWKYRISKLPQGTGRTFQAVYSPRRNLSVCLNYRYRQKEKDVLETGERATLPVHHRKFRCRLTYMPKGFVCHTAVDYNHFRQQDGKGYGFEGKQGRQCSQSCAYTFSGSPLAVSVQGTYLHTDDHDSQTYVSEKGLLHTFYTPSFYGRRFRYSAHVRYGLNKISMLLVKFGQTVHQDHVTVGSGSNLIEGNKEMDLQMQLHIKF